MHIGGLPPRLSGRVALGYVVVCDRAVSEHAPEMMDELSAVACVIPTARLWEEGISNQRAYQGSESNEEVKSLQKCQKCTTFCFVV